MDRNNRFTTGGTIAVFLGVVLSGAGCHSMRNEVPPGRPYSTTGGTPPPLGFNSDPHPNTSIGAGGYGSSTGPGLNSADGAGAVGAGSPTQFGTPSPTASPYGAPTANRYAAPGSAAAGP